jgi:hypothetical protein
MKSIAIVTFSLAFGVTRLVLADDVVKSNTSKKHSGQASAQPTGAHPQPATSIRPSFPAKNAARIEPHSRIRQNYPGLAHPVERGSLAMNVSRDAQYYRPAGIVDRSGRGHHTGRTKNGFEMSTANNQIATDNRQSYLDALKRCRHERHDRNWWNRHCRTIVFVNTGYYYLDTGYWYPAYGYDPAYDVYDNDGPIYTYGNLLPDQVIANVQAALRDAGYYLGPITGSLGPATRAALSNFQRDYGLFITAAIDEPTVQSLGLI